MRFSTDGRFSVIRQRCGESCITSTCWIARRMAAAIGKRMAFRRLQNFRRNMCNMRKYDVLWEYVQKSGQMQLTLTFDEIGRIAGVPLDHAFLNCKKELTAYGYAVKKISMKTQTVVFVRNEDDA